MSLDEHKMLLKALYPILVTFTNLDISLKNS